MIELNNNFTNQDQSKRLLALGLPANTADCYMAKNGNGIMSIGVLHGEKFSDYKNRSILFDVQPCWSVGRLIEIYCILNNIDDYLKVPLDWYHNLTDVFFDLLKLGKNDFSKLEDKK